MLSDLQLASSLNNWVASSPELVSVAIFLARWLILGFILLGIFLVSTGRNVDRHAVIEAIWSVFLVLGTTAIMAKFVGRARPFLLPPEMFFHREGWTPIMGMIPPPYNTSFPSGHTGTAIAMAAAIFHANRRLGIVAFVVAGLIGVGRVAVGVHYPTDILGGIVVGLLAFSIVRFCHRELRRSDLTNSVKSHKHT